MSGRPILDVADLHAGYRGVEAVRGIDLRIHAGEIATVIGANGAGKSTLLNGIMGILPVRGTIAFFGRAVNHLPIEARVALGLSLVPERRELFTTMSVKDNLRLGAFRIRDRTRSKTALALEEIFHIFPKLKERSHQLAGTLSGGERQMLAMGRALMSQPRLLMLDEPSLGLAPLVVRDILSVISSLRARGVAILLVEQNARAALQIADRGYVMENGVCALAGSSAELRADNRVVETYLGLNQAKPPP